QREHASRLEAEALARVGRELTQSLHVPTVGQRIVDTVVGALGGAVAVLYAVEAESADLVAMARSGPLAARVGAEHRGRRGAGLVGVAVRERQTVVSANVLRDARISYPPEERDQVERAGHQAACVIPLMIQQDVIGALSIGYEPGRLFDADTKRLAERLGALATVALQNARSFAREGSARAEAEMANRAKDEFLAMLGHELRNPLGAASNAMTLLNIMAPDERTAKPREIIVRQLGHLSRLVDDLLDVGRLTSGRLEMKRTTVDLGTLV